MAAEASRLSHRPRSRKPPRVEEGVRERKERSDEMHAKPQTSFSFSWTIDLDESFLVCRFDPLREEAGDGGRLTRPRCGGAGEEGVGKGEGECAADVASEAAWCLSSRSSFFSFCVTVVLGDSGGQRRGGDAIQVER